MKISDHGIELIAQREGEVLHGYLDSVRKLTIGVGHLVLPGEPYKLNQPITLEESRRLLRIDLASAEKAVNAALKVPVTQNMFDAAISLAFNIGNGGFTKSSVVRNINTGNPQKAADSFLAWNKAGGKISKGLTVRRNAERHQFLTPDGA